MTDAQPIGDHYATLGVMPKCEDVVVRAAYLALMHRYHPDKSSTPASTDRAQAIIAAFAVLGDPEKRIRYDWDRRRAAEELARPQPSRLAGMKRALIAVPIMLLLGIALLLVRPPQLNDSSLIPPATARREAAAFPRSPAVSAPVKEPSATSLAEETPRPTPKPDKIVKAVTIEEQAATPRTDSPPPVPAPMPRAELASIERPQARADVRVVKRLTDDASAKCLAAKSTTAACNNDNLVALDRLGEAFYGQSWRVGNASKRAALLVSRTGFLGRREACRTDSCLRGAYLTHMREISAIAESKQPTPR